MVKKNNSNTLLTKTKVRKRPVSSANAEDTRASNLHNSNGLPAAEQQGGKQRSASAKLMLYGAFILLFALLLIPKPQLLTYQKLSMVATSIYLPPLLGGPVLLDSTLAVQSISEDNNLYLCQDLSQVSSCQKYQIIKREGVFAVIMHLFSD